MKAIAKIKMSLASCFGVLASLSLGIATMTSCSGFLDQESDRVILADQEHLNQAEDTLYSVLGVVNKLQAIADRTILLGELRGDLSDITSKTSADLRAVAMFNVNDTTNAYNSPSDYYAVINNCNYFIAHADTALKNSSNEYIFRKEMAVVKAYRAWTYMQLAQVYGRVPFFTEPILSNADANKDFPKYDMQQICQYFLNDLAGLENIETPGYGTIRSVDTKLFYFPIYVLEGDMNLWLGNYREAALCYYRYISTRNGTNQPYAISNSATQWYRADTHWLITNDSWSANFDETSYTTSNEIVTLIPGDSIPSEGNYSQLRNLYNSNSNNDYQASIVPSQSLMDLSAAQVNCVYTSTQDILYAPKTLTKNQNGDLRLSSAYESVQDDRVSPGRTVNVVSNQKFTSRNVNVYRRTMVYLRMAEALNRAGFPRFAFEILKNGVTDDIIAANVLPYYPDDQEWLSQFSFPTNNYVTRTGSYPELSAENTLGIHSHGSGWSEYNAYYTMPDNAELSGTELLNYQIEAVEDLITDEEALEFAFEGQRFYDLMRIALRRNDPSYLADRIYKRRGESNVAEMKSLIQKDLYQTSNWYLPLP